MRLLHLNQIRNDLFGHIVRFLLHARHKVPDHTLCTKQIIRLFDSTSYLLCHSTIRSHPDTGEHDFHRLWE